MNRNLQGKDKDLVTFPELQPFLRSFFGLCYYQAKITHVKSHPKAYPVVMDSINDLVGVTFGLATSLDGWARMKVKASDARVDDISDDDGSCAWENEGNALDPQRLVSINNQDSLWRKSAPKGCLCKGYTRIFLNLRVRR